MVIFDASKYNSGLLDYQSLFLPIAVFTRIVCQNKKPIFQVDYED